MNYSHITLSGHLVRDAELRHTQDGKAVATGTLAVNTGWGDRKKTSFYRLTLFGPKAEAFEKLGKKGAGMLVAGEHSIDEWEGKEGRKMKTNEVVVQTWEVWKYAGPEEGEPRREREAGRWAASDFPDAGRQATSGFPDDEHDKAWLDLAKRVRQGERHVISGADADRLLGELPDDGISEEEVTAIVEAVVSGRPLRERSRQEASPADDGVMHTAPESVEEDVLQEGDALPENDEVPF